MDGTTFVHGNGAQVAVSAAGTFLYDETAGTLSWDDDGTGVHTAVVIATLTGTPGLTVNDFDFIT